MSYAWRIKGAVVLLGSLFVGCTSFTSTHLYRDEADARWKHDHIKGIPITLKVPTHVKLTVIERRYAKSDGVLLQIPTQAGLPARDLAVRDVNYELIETEKIFAVDMKRPAAGTIKAKAAFGGDQYIDNLAYNVDDETIQEVGKLIATIIGGIPTIATAFPTTAGARPAGLTPVDSVVATAIFKLDDPALEFKIAEFLQYTCSQPTGPVIMSAVPGGTPMPVGTVDIQEFQPPPLPTGEPVFPQDH